jgi:hypothetical protein
LSDLSFSDTRIHTFNCCDRCEDNESFHKEELIEHKLRELNEQNAQNEEVLDEDAQNEEVLDEDTQNEVLHLNDYKFNKKNNDFNIVNRVQKKENKNKKKKEIKNKTEVKVNMHKQLNKLGKKLATQFALNKISHFTLDVDVHDIDVELGDVSKENHVVFSKPTKQQRRIMDKSRHRERSSKMAF